MIGSVTDANSVDIDSTTYSEFMVVVKNNGGQSATTIFATLAYPSGHHISLGVSSSNDTYMCADIVVYPTYIKLSKATISGSTDVLSTSTMEVYGRI